VVEDGTAYYQLTQASPIQNAGATPNVVAGFTFLTSSSLNVDVDEYVRLEFELGSGYAAPVTITATEIPGFLNLYDNGDGTANLEGYQVLKSSFQIILKATDDDANTIEKRFYLNPEGQISPAEDGVLLSEDEEGYGDSNEEETVVEESAGAIDHFFVLMLMLIAGLRFQLRKS
jgi:hypothetical protein